MTELQTASNVPGVFRHTRFTIRKKFWSFLGATFYLLDDADRQIGYCRQKAFKLREDIRVCTDESQTTELLVIKARSIIDFGATYDVMDPAAPDVPLGSLRRKGMMSTFVRDEWMIFNQAGQEIGLIQENSTALALLRRFMGGVIQLIAPQSYTMTLGGVPVADFVTNRWQFFYKLFITVRPEVAAQVDPRVVVAGAVLIAAIEGVQK